MVSMNRATKINKSVKLLMPRSLPVTTIIRILAIISSLKNTKAPGLYLVNNRHLKQLPISVNNHPISRQRRHHLYVYYTRMGRFAHSVRGSKDIPPELVANDYSVRFAKNAGIH